MFMQLKHLIIATDMFVVILDSRTTDH